ncbi:MAG: DUF6496 domain-containing protein [Ignavibacteria bacterium]
MPNRKTIERARKDEREGKSPSVQAGEFVREEMHELEKAKGKRRVKSRKQAVAIGLSEARRAGVKLKPPKEGSASGETRRKAERDLAKGTDSRNDAGTTGRRAKTRH